MTMQPHSLSPTKEKASHWLHTVRQQGFGLRYAGSNAHLWELCLASVLQGHQCRSGS